LPECRLDIPAAVQRLGDRGEYPSPRERQGIGPIEAVRGT
jgi:hypothetical protein